MRYRITLLLIILPLMLSAQRQRKMTREEYIDTYKELAMKEMVRARIPASITLAQGILESGDGNSKLARKGNNHFGIKCHDWKGKSMKHDDDEKNECFRKYKSVEQSYRDHSDFLTGRERYAGLFELKITDYKGWAKGLKKAGYATSPTYAKVLIRLIEENELYKYDKEVLKNGGGKGRIKRTRKSNYISTEYAGSRKLYYNNRVKYVVAMEGDRFYNLSEELDLFEWQLPKYNDMPESKVFNEGEIVYLQPKRNKADVNHKQHVVKKGETLLDISQQYAVRLDKLAKRNLLKPDSELQEGQIILLRGKTEGKREINLLPNLQLKDESNEEIIIDFNADK